jgi:NAD(P)-dependent dehydrogenase (short-subunit alcohol dehydrogenase family)
MVNDEHVVVVGGSSGIGLGVARAVLALGARVTIAGRSSERLAHARRALGDDDRVRAIAADIGNEDDVIRLFDLAGPIDHLVTTAVDAAYQSVTELEPTAARRVIDSKLVGALLLAKHGAPCIRAGGSITYTSGIAAYRPSRGGAVVAAVNGALAALGRALAIELAPVRVNVVSPGWVDTPVWDTVAGDRKADVLSAMADRLPVGRVGTPDDLAPAFIYLMRSAYSTGTVLHVDGGHRLV